MKKKLVTPHELALGILKITVLLKRKNITKALRLSLIKTRYSMKLRYALAMKKSSITESRVLYLNSLIER